MSDEALSVVRCRLGAVPLPVLLGLRLAAPMIVEALWALVSGILTGLLDLAPDWALPPTAGADTAEAVGSMAAWANGYFPLNDLLICCAAYIAARVFFGLWGVVVWVYDRIPFKAT